MEVLLLQDIQGIGKKNDLLLVGDGYALNCLLPRKMAIVATPVVRRRFADDIKRRAEEKEQERQQQESVAGELQGKKVKFTRKVTKTGKLYAAITEDAIAEALKEQLKLDVAAENINIPEHIKSVGTHPVTVQLASQKLPLSVVVDKEEA